MWYLRSMPGKCKPCSFNRDVSAEAELFKVLGDPHRLRILATLARCDDAVCVCDLNGGLPLLQPTVSHHLKVLKDAGLVDAQRQATWVYYRLAKGALSKIGRAIEVIFPERIAA